MTDPRRRAVLLARLALVERRLENPPRSTRLGELTGSVDAAVVELERTRAELVAALEALDAGTAVGEPVERLPYRDDD